jgi:predicted AAA+ superfamily ATPase
VKSAKLYFNDTGLLCFLLGLSNDSLGNSSLTGAVWENYVLIEIATWLGLYHPEWTLWFYRDQQNREADFLIQGPFEQVRIIDAKWAEMPKAESFKKLQQVAESVLRARGVEKAEIAIAGRSETTRQLGEDRTLVSAFELANYLARQ